MKRPDKRPREGVLREDAGTADKGGFIAPSIGALEHALYFTAAPSVTEKAKQVLDEGRLRLPGVVVVWDETVGRRKGSRAVPKGWWAEAGSLTAAFAFPAHAKVSQQKQRSQIAAAVIRVIESFQPDGELTFRPPNDLFLGEKKLGAVFAESHEGADLAIVRLNCTPDLSKAPATIAASACRLIDFIDERQLPLQRAGTLPNTLLTRLMTELPKEFGPAQ
jgi:biotin-(acetyl-CoA carboxylase) ligase